MFFEEKYPLASFEYKTLNRKKLKQFEEPTDSISFAKIQDNILKATWKQIRKVTKTIKGAMTTVNLKEQKFIELRNDEGYVKYLSFRVWEHSEILNVYFLYMNPIIVCSAYNHGWTIIIVDLITLMILDFVSDKAAT